MYEDDADADLYALWSEATEHTRAYDDAAVLRMLAELAELRKDRARLDWLDGASWNDDRIGNGIAIFPSTDLAGDIRCVLQDLGDEDGSNLGDVLSVTQYNLRDAIDAAMEST